MDKLRIENARSVDVVYLVPNDGTEKVPAFKAHLHQNGSNLAVLMELCAKRDNSDIEVPFSGEVVKSFCDWLLDDLCLTNASEFTLWMNLTVFAQFYMIDDLSDALLEVVAPLLKVSRVCQTCSLVVEESKSDCLLTNSIQKLAQAFAFAQKHNLWTLISSVLEIVHESMPQGSPHQRVFIEQLSSPCICLNCTGALTSMEGQTE